MQSEQIMKPQGHVQQKGCSRPHVAHTYFSGRLHVFLGFDTVVSL